MSRRKLPPSSKKSVSQTIAPAILRGDPVPALDEAEVFPHAAVADAPTAPVAGGVGEPPVIDVASEMTARFVVDEPERLLAPDELVAGDPDAPAAPPRRAPPGDCRSLRRPRGGAPALFALIYRHGSTLIMRTGTTGSLGVWRTVDYPSPAAAARAYAREACMFVDDGYVDVA